MNIAENIHNSWHIIGRNKVRSFLTMLGVIIGVMSVIIIVSVGGGAQSLILNQIQSMGSNLIGVLPGKSDEKGPPASVMGVELTTLKEDDGQAIASGDFPHILSFSGYVKGVDTVAWSERKTDTTFVGVSAGYPEIEDAELASGRFFSEEDDRAMARYAVLGSQVAEDLFEDISPVGRQLKIKRVNFTVIGVMKARGVSGFQNQDNQIFTPLKTAQKLLLGIDYVSFMRFKVDDKSNIGGSVEYVKQVLRERHNISNPENDDFSVRSMAQGMEVLTNITNALRLFLTAIAAIALIVGGIGIMNIMLAAVRERTREIGLRKAVGATSRRIMEQFLVETALITFCAGVVGIVLGAAASVVIALVAQKSGYDWDLIISVPSILLGCVVSIGIGLLFGFFPARRASRLDPIEALRYE